MRADRSIRLLLSLAVVLALLLVLAAALFLTEQAFQVWGHLQTAPRFLFYTYLSALGLLAAGSGWVVWRLLLPRRRVRASPEPQELTEASLRQRMEEAQAKGVDVAGAERELAALGQRRRAGEVFVSLLGEVSTGKSTLIRALLPDQPVLVSVRAGTTRAIQHYTWRSPAGDRLTLIDMPGLHEPGGAMDAAAREEALRAHVAVYVCDGDLTRAQHAELRELLALAKPTIVAINKADRYAEEELAQVRARILERVRPQAGARVQVVAISAGGEEQIVRVDAQGRETVVHRGREPQVEALKRALQEEIDRNAGALEELRDSAVFVLVARKLDAAEAVYRQEQGAALVKQYTRRAVVGALAAVAPGTDLLIQGYLGTRLVRELCELHGAPVRDLDVQQFLELAQKHVGRALPLLLAVAGNAFKAFPGAGTIAGGLMHAVAYGLIFDALGNSLAATLEAGGILRPVAAAQLFKEKLSDDLEARTRRLAGLALEARREPRD